MHDLAQLANQTFDEILVRRLWVLKVQATSSTTDAATSPSTPTQLLTLQRGWDFQTDSIGIPTQPIGVPDGKQNVTTGSR